MKIILSEQQYDNLLTEVIRNSEVRTDMDSIMSVAEGKRGVGFITLYPDSRMSHIAEKMIEDNDLRMVRCPSRPINVVIYRPKSRKDAMELVSIAEKYNGYLAYNATEEDSRRIGQLLSYHEDDINDYINRTGKYKR
jgi:hypothetical protein